jgi:hypothetical protein
MAARIRARHQDEIREKIRASQLVNVLESHVLGKRKLAATQVNAALGLLRKCVPDLQATQISSDPDNPIPPLVVIGPYEPTAKS